jgi:hypothetical protein
VALYTQRRAALQSAALRGKGNDDSRLKLLQCTGVGLLNHGFVGCDVDFNTTVLSATFGSVV